jgi:hypothetical protein
VPVQGLKVSTAVRVSTEVRVTAEPERGVLESPEDGVLFWGDLGGNFGGRRGRGLGARSWLGLGLCPWAAGGHTDGGLTRRLGGHACGGLIHPPGSDAAPPPHAGVRSAYQRSNVFGYSTRRRRVASGPSSKRRMFLRRVPECAGISRSRRPWLSC